MRYFCTIFFTLLFKILFFFRLPRKIILYSPDETLKKKFRMRVFHNMISGKKILYILKQFYCKIFLYILIYHDRVIEPEAIRSTISQVTYYFVEKKRSVIYHMTYTAHILLLYKCVVIFYNNKLSCLHKPLISFN